MRTALQKGREHVLNFQYHNSTPQQPHEYIIILMESRGSLA